MMEDPKDVRKYLDYLHTLDVELGGQNVEKLFERRVKLLQLEILNEILLALKKKK
ncbi:MAG: hypothetical protein APG08_00377 [Candidatus Methanofastidiosum methylothiophilum]|uniref:Uncharacterized protein n=1 Tax=Candidatus Methanofastidiosum methylothiophilum TaxID=1705564 RepID=A0A150JDE3_9EURY|nr:MAG: hypothetical protein AN188_00229 [Candidatus Methanofastidiosum methylthiophilus]KYC57096.1 MAG: hypothetical protein APG08_00377 [Candidatus Methanofastidiosum methylthiophilus]OQC52514.1 MAG: hypothetical protein BWX56_00231 [Euryarchaeota archaeon ADurb.Bin023]